jgi:hypothetical protein
VTEDGRKTQCETSFLNHQEERQERSRMLNNNNNHNNKSQQSQIHRISSHNKISRSRSPSRSKFYIITRRWKFHACKFNFWAGHTNCLRKLPRMKLCKFLVLLLTHMSAIDKEVLSLTRALCPQGTRCEHISNLLREQEFDHMQLLDAHEEQKKPLLNTCNMIQYRSLCFAIGTDMLEKYLQGTTSQQFTKKATMAFVHFLTPR